MNLIERIKQVKKIRDTILENYQTTEMIADEIKYAAKFINTKNLQMFENLLFIKNENNNWFKIETNGEKLEVAVDVMLQSFYSSFSQNERKKISKEVMVMLNNKDISPENIKSKTELIFNNGVLNLETFEFVEIDYETLNLIPMVKFDFNFKENISINENLEKLIKWWTQNNDEKRISLFQILGALISGYQVQYIFNFYGVEGSGKTLLSNLIKNIIGQRFICSTSIISLQDKFGKAQVLGKKIVIDPDTSESEIDPYILKQLTGDDNLTIEIKHKGFIDYRPQLNVLLISNEMLNFSGSSFEGLNRRLICFNFPFSTTNFATRHWDLDFEPLSQKELESLKDGENFNIETLETIASLSLKEFHLLYKQKNNFKFNETKEMLEVKDKNKELINNVYNYYNNCFEFKELFTKLNDFEYYAKGYDLYSNYKHYALSNGLKPYSNQNFYKKLKEILIRNIDDIENIETSKVKMINGKSERVFLITTKWNIYGKENNEL